MTSECDNPQDTEPRSLPLDVFGIIAEWLVAQDELATCAALNATSKYVQDETRPTLWRRVVYHFKNGPRSEESRDKKAGIKWRATFGSVAAEYIQYLIVIPSVLPEFDNDIPPWEPPFLDLITSRPNRLKSCLIPGQSNMVSVTLFQHYQPCSTDLNQVMVCGEILRRLTNRKVPCALVRLYKQTRTDDRQMSDAEIEAAFDRQQENIQDWSVTVVPFLDLRLLLSPHETVTDDFITRLSVDIIAWMSLPVYICCDGKLGAENQRTVAESLHLDVRGALFRQTLAFGRALRIAYDVDFKFASLQVRVKTRDPITPEQARQFTQVMERSFVETSPFFLDRPSGGVLIQDGSRVSAKRNSGPGMKCLSVMMRYDIDKTDPVPNVRAYRAIGFEGITPGTEERLYLERKDGHLEKAERDLEFIYERVGLFR